MSEQLLREWIRKVLLTEAQLHEGQILGYIAEWSVYAAISSNMPTISVTEIAMRPGEDGIPGSPEPSTRKARRPLGPGTGRHSRPVWQTSDPDDSVWNMCIKDGRIAKPYAEAGGKDESDAKKKNTSTNKTLHANPDDPDSWDLPGLQGSDELVRYQTSHGGRTPRQQKAYEAYAEMARVFHRTTSGQTFGGPEGDMTPSSQPTTAEIDVPCVEADIHVKYNDKSRLESFRREAISKSMDVIHGLVPGAPSTEIYDTVIAAIMQSPAQEKAGTNIAMDFDEYKWLTVDLNPPFTTKDLFVQAKDRLGTLKTKRHTDKGKKDVAGNPVPGTKLRRPNELSGTKPLWHVKRPALIRAALKADKDAPTWDRKWNGIIDNPKSDFIPLGLIPQSAVGVKAAAKLSTLGVSGYGGGMLRGAVQMLSDQDGGRPWWNVQVSGGPKPLDQNDLQTLARYDDVSMAYQAWTTVRANLLKGEEGAEIAGKKIGGRTQLYEKLEGAGYLAQLKKDLFKQHFRGLDAAVQDDTGTTAATSLEVKTAYYAKFKGSPGSYSVDVLRYPKVPKESDLEIRKNDGPTDTLYKISAPVKAGGPMLEMLKLEYSFSGQNKPPTLTAGRDYSKFVEAFWLPTNFDRVIADTIRLPSLQIAMDMDSTRAKQLAAAYVREMLKLLYS